MNRNVAAPIFWKGSAKRYVYNCRHLSFENANRDVAIVQAGLNFCRGFAPLSGIAATHPNQCSDHVDVSNLSYGVGSGASTVVPLFLQPASCCGQGFLTSRTHFRLPTSSLRWLRRWRCQALVCYFWDLLSFEPFWNVDRTRSRRRWSKGRRA